jgi:hypothetical protein
VLAHTFRADRDSGIILWTAKMPFQVELVTIRPVHEKGILRQLTGWSWHHFRIADDSGVDSEEVN